jgi:N-acetylneuraminic acid mutarotase
MNGMTCTVHKNNLVYFTGVSDENKKFNEKVYEVDMNTLIWKVLEGVKLVARFGAEAHIYEDEIYVIGGNNRCYQNNISIIFEKVYLQRSIISKGMFFLKTQKFVDFHFNFDNPENN